MRDVHFALILGLLGCEQTRMGKKTTNIAHTDRNQLKWPEKHIDES
jgi:hypothetical protein